MFVKIIVISVMILILVSLAGALKYLIKDEGKSRDMAKALTWRIGLSLGLFLVLLVGFSTGYLIPHG